MLTAVKAPLYDIGVLSDRGMLPGLDAIPAAAVIDRLALLKYRNARGSHIYIRPSDELWIVSGLPTMHSEPRNLPRTAISDSYLLASNMRCDAVYRDQS
jgi:hypothetical protein